MVLKNEILPFAATWIDLDIIILSEVSRTNTNITQYYFDVETKKMMHRYLFTKQTNRN